MYLSGLPRCGHSTAFVLTALATVKRGGLFIVPIHHLKIRFTIKAKGETVVVKNHIMSDDRGFVD